MDQRITGNSLRLYETHRRGNGADGDRKLRVFENDMNQRQDSKDISRWIKLKTEPMKREEKRNAVPSGCFVCREVLKQVVSRESSLAAGREARGTVP